LVWICFKDKERQKAIKGFEHETRRKHPAGRLRTRWKQHVRKNIIYYEEYGTELKRKKRRAGWGGGGRGKRGKTREEC
jgi:hypothetical protein